MPASILAAAGVSEVTPEQHPEQLAWEPQDDPCWRRSRDGAPDRSTISLHHHHHQRQHAAHAVMLTAILHTLVPTAPVYGTNGILWCLFDRQQPDLASHAFQMCQPICSKFALLAMAAIVIQWSA